MTIGQEQLAELEVYAKQQRRIYPDACDFGVEATPEVRKDIRRICTELAADYNSMKKVEPYPTGATRKWCTIIPIEISDYYPDCYDVLVVEVTLVESTGPRAKDYFEINMKRDRAPRSYKFFKEAA